MSSTSAYSTIVSPRSRLLRTIGLALLVGILAMVIYGYFGLMPSLARSLRTNPVSAPHTTVAAQNRESQLDLQQYNRAQRIRKMRVSVALAYWGVCALMLVGVVLVAWLDLREISRTYVAERRAMWSEAADRLNSPEEPS